MHRPRVAFAPAPPAMSYCGVHDDWIPTHDAPALAPGEVHVWRASLDPGADTLDRLRSTLEPDEHARAERFRVAHGQRRFVAARGVLRDVLARYTGRDAASLRFEYGERGKPSLAGGPHFNLSHAAETALLAVSAIAPMGVDVEAMRELPDLDDIATRYFAAGEIAALRRASREDYVSAWYRCWTRKEAYIKATGDGLHCPLDRFEVSVLHGDAPAIRSLDGDADAARGWTVHHLETGPGTVGALAIAAPVRAVRRFDWRPRDAR